MNRKDSHFLFFSENINGNAVLLDGDETSHISNVLRFCEGDEIQVTDGKGNIFTSKIVKMKKDSTLCEIISPRFCEPIFPEITVAVGLPEKEKLEDICEMLAPLGVKRIVPLISQNCRKNYLDGRWEKVLQRCRRKIVSSVKQSLNPYICEILPPIKPTDFISGCELNLLADPDGEAVLKDLTAKSLCIFIGPPAGFSHDETDLLSQGAVKFSLGKYRLRSELAAVVAVGKFL